MTFISNNEFRPRQSSDDWQEGVRLENRLRKIEGDVEELNRRIWWYYVSLGALGLLIIGLFLKH